MDGGDGDGGVLIGRRGGVVLPVDSESTSVVPGMKYRESQ